MIKIKLQLHIIYSYNSDPLAIANANLIREFGSLNPSVSNVIYTNGALDPYLNTGILVARDASEVVIIIEGKKFIKKMNEVLHSFVMFKVTLSRQTYCLLT